MSRRKSTMWLHANLSTVQSFRGFETYLVTAITLLPIHHEKQLYSPPIASMICSFSFATGKSWPSWLALNSMKGLVSMTRLSSVPPMPSECKANMTSKSFQRKIIKNKSCIHVRRKRGRRKRKRSPVQWKQNIKKLSLILHGRLWTFTQ